MASIVALMSVQPVWIALDSNPGSEREKAWVRKVRREREKYIVKNSDHLSLLRLFSKFREMVTEKGSLSREQKQWGRSLNINVRELQEAHNISTQLESAIEEIYGNREEETKE